MFYKFLIYFFILILPIVFELLVAGCKQNLDLKVIDDHSAVINQR
jgi:hypothetical protein